METEYLLVQSNKKKEFEKELQSRLNEGWQLLGDVAIHAAGKGPVKYGQSLIYKSK